MRRDLVALMKARAGAGSPSQAASVRDVLVDLRHFCDAKRLNFQEKIDGSYQVYLEERREAFGGGQ